MKIKSLTLYKTELDAQYTNVIDGGRDDSYNLSTLKTDIFDAFFSPYVIYNSNNIKSVKETDGVCVISIGKEYEDILSEGYNYAIINTGKKNIYYFIVGMESLNDGPTPSMFITLERDAWCNNIAYFTNHIEDDANNVVRSHFNRWYGSNGKYYPYYYNSDDGTDFTPVKDEEMLYYGGGGNVVWCGVRFSRDTIVSGNMLNGLIGQLRTLFGTKTFKYEIITNLIKNVVSGMEIKTAIESAVDDTEVREGLQQWSTTNWKSLNDTSWFGASQYEAANPLFYFPVAIQTGVSDGVPNYNFVFTCNGHSYDFTSTNYIMAAFNFDAEEITDAFLTLLPPFPYTVSGSTITTGTGVGMTNTPLRNSSGTKFIFPYNPGVDFWYIIQCPVSSAHKELNYTYTNELTGIDPKGSIGSKLFNPNASYNDIKLLEPRIYCRPYVDVNVSVGQYKENVPIIYDRTNIKMIVSMGLKSEPNVSLFLNNLLLSAYNGIGSLGKLPTSYDKWKDYVVSQGINMGLAAVGGYNPIRTSTVERTHSAVDTYQHRIKEQYKGTPDNDIANTTKWDSYKNVGPKSVSSVSKSGGGYRTSSLAGGVINGVGKGLEITGSATQPNMPSILANNNLELQIPRVVVSKWSVERELDDLLANLHLYGYTHGETQSVKHNTRVWWDFCRTESCSLPAIKNYRDRQILQDAFNRGVTKWHAELSAFGFKNDFSRNCNNIERNYVNALEAEMAFKFFDDNRPLDNFGTSGIGITAELNSGILTEYGVEAKDSSNAIIINNALSFGNYNVLQLKITKPPKSWNNCVIANFGNLWKFRTSATYNGFRFASGDNDGELVYNPANPDDIVGKTISIQYHTSGGSYYGTILKVYIDNTEVYSKNFVASTSTWDTTYLMNNCEGMIIASHYGTVLNDTVSNEWIAKHQIPGPTAPQYTVTVQYNAGTDSKTDTIKKYMGTYTVGDIVNDIPANYDIETITVDGQEKTLTDTITITGNTVITATCKKSYKLTTTATTQYINTLITPRPGIRVKFNALIGIGNTSYDIFGATDNTVANRFYAYLQYSYISGGAELYYYTSNGYPYTGMSNDDKNNYNEYETKADGLYINGIKRIAQGNPINTYNLPIYIFNCNSNNTLRNDTAVGMSMTFFYIYDSDGTLLFKGDASEDNNGVLCMYDSISNKYFYLDGTNKLKED